MAERTAPSQRSSMPKIRKGKPAPRACSKGQTVITTKRQQRRPQAYVQVCGRNIKEKAPSVPRSTRLNVKREGPKCTMKYTAKRQRESPKRACEVRG